MRYVIGCEVALRLATDRPALRDDVHLVAPTLIRSQLLAVLYQSVQRGELTRADAEQQLDAGFAAALTGLVPVASWDELVAGRSVPAPAPD